VIDAIEGWAIAALLVWTAIVTALLYLRGR
jgi:hypothetical protein